MLISAISGGLVGQCSGLRARCAALEDFYIFINPKPEGLSPISQAKLIYLMPLTTRDNILS